MTFRLAQIRRLLFGGAVPLFAMSLALGLGLTLGCKKKPTMEIYEKTSYLAIPPASDWITSIDFSRLRNRDKIQQLLKETETQQPGYGKIMNALRTRVGFDPFQDIDMLYLGKMGKTDPLNPMKSIIFVARGNFQNPKPKLDKLLEWLGEEYLVAPPPFTQSVFEESGIQRYKSTKAQSQYNEKLFLDLNFAFPTEHLMLFSMDANLLDQSLAIVTQTAEDMRKDPFWQTMLKRPSIGAMAWGAGHISPALANGLPGGLKANDYFFDLNFNENFDFELGLVCASIEAATAITNQLKAQAAAMKPAAAPIAAAAPETVGLIDKLYFLTEKEVTRISLKLDAEQSRKLWEEWDRLAQQGSPAAVSTPAATPAPAIPPVATPGG